MTDSIITLPVLKQVDHAIALIYKLSMSHNNRSPLRRKDRKKKRQKERKAERKKEKHPFPSILCHVVLA